MKHHASIPKGLCPPAQGCEARVTLGHRIKFVINPNGVAAFRVMEGTQPRWGCGRMVDQFSQGSTLRATLGFGTESRWDSPSAQIRTLQRGGLGKAHQLFGEQLPKLLDELNEVLAA